MNRKREDLHRLRSVVERLHKETGGRGKWWHAAKRSITLAVAIHSARGARKVALQRQFDALVRNYSA
ncbi:MAG TPA: hypothetical protein VNP53_05050 [Methylomirabilota bacterium]|jgi:hypothetical protein|nr:hypothetical protein [Methylomirabilota bacterium]